MQWLCPYHLDGVVGGIVGRALEKKNNGGNEEMAWDEYWRFGCAVRVINADDVGQYYVIGVGKMSQIMHPEFLAVHLKGYTTACQYDEAGACLHVPDLIHEDGPMSEFYVRVK